MKRHVALLVAGAVVAGLGLAGAGQAAARTTGTTTGTTTTTTTTTCAWGPLGLVRNQVCLTVNGSLASATGYSATSGGVPRPVSYNLETRAADGFVLEREDVTATVPAGGLTVGPVASNVPCGSGVTAVFRVTTPGWPPLTATVTAPVTC
ncbi:hypothetical protein ACFVVL_01830 [Kitasatospora sp. NPDC058115]|uniref:hypothetical protein n=1 Tax=Kitasatospora sp. NPDC058115 TaxID=3346347 RepID=UPI0036D88EEF